MWGSQQWGQFFPWTRILDRWKAKKKKKKNPHTCKPKETWIMRKKVLTRINYKVSQKTLLHSPYAIHAAAKSHQSCPTLCDPIDGSPPGSPVPGILQARTLEWVTISFSKAWKWKVKVKSVSCFQFLATPWTATHQAPPSMGFSRQEYWSGLPLPSPMPYISMCK